MTLSWTIGVAAIAFGIFALFVRRDYAERVARASKVSGEAKRRLESEIFLVGLISLVVGIAMTATCGRAETLPHHWWWRCTAQPRFSSVCVSWPSHHASLRS